MNPSGDDPFSDDLFAQLSTGADEDLQHLVDSLGGDPTTLLQQFEDTEIHAAALQPAAPPPVPTDSDTWEDCALHTEKHQVHKVMHENTEEKEYIVSNMRLFEIVVVLVNLRASRPSPNRLRLVARLLYENSNPVRAIDGEPLLTGDTHVTVTEGRAHLRLKMGKTALSARHGHQRFRVKIEPEDEQLAATYPSLSQLTEPLKAVTKLNPPATPTAANRPSASEPSPTLPDYALRPTTSLGAGTGDESPAGSTCMQWQAMSSARGSGADAAAATTSATTETAMPGTAAAGGRPGTLQAQLAEGRSEGESIQSIVEQQRQQIEQLTRENRLMLEELTRVRSLQQ